MLIFLEVTTHCPSTLEHFCRRCLWFHLLLVLWYWPRYSAPKLEEKTGVPWGDFKLKMCHHHLENKPWRSLENAVLAFEWQQHTCSLIVLCYTFNSLWQSLTCQFWCWGWVILPHSWNVFDLGNKCNSLNISSKHLFDLGFKSNRCLGLMLG